MKDPISGPFKPYMEGLIEQKKAMGHPYEKPARILKAFSLFCLHHYPQETVLTRTMAMHWAERRQDENVNTLRYRITPIRQLAKYMNCMGTEAYVIPDGIPGKRTRYVPHIFTDQELRAFFTAVDQCPVSRRSPALH